MLFPVIKDLGSLAQDSPPVRLPNACTGIMWPFHHPTKRLILQLLLLL